MSNRFHNKFHRQNHHSKRTTKNNTYADAGYDPIASFEVPFQGEFYSEGDILTTENLSAQQGIFSETLTTKGSVQIGGDLNVQGKAQINDDLTVKQDLSAVGNSVFDGNVSIKQNLSAIGNSVFDSNVLIKQNLNIVGDSTIDGSLVLSGNLTVLGSAVQLDTIVTSSSAIAITNLGTGPALTVTQHGTQPIAHFIDANGEDIIFDDNGYVGLGTNSPNEKLTIVGSISSTQNFYLNSDAQIGNNLTVSQNISSSGSINIGTISNGATNDVITKDSNNTLEVREINSRVWDTSANFLSGALTQNYLSKFDSESTLINSVIYNDGANVGVNTSSPNEALTVVGNVSAVGDLYITGSEFLSGDLTLTQNISSLGTVTIGTISTGSTNDVIIKDSNNTLETREVNSRIWDTNANLLSGALTQNKLPKFDSNSSLIDSLIYDDGNFVGINTTSPTDTFTVQGSSKFFGNVTIFGDLTAAGTSTFANTVFSTTSALSVVHIGSGPAAWIGNDGSGDIASFYDIDQNLEVLHIGGNNSSFPNVGVKTSTPNKDFTVKGELSASNVIYDSIGNSTNWNSVYSSVASVSGDWNSVYSSVAPTSANWNSVYSSVASVSGNWDSVYSSVANTSANWDSVYSNVQGASADWNSVYSSVAPTSANWNSVYSSVAPTSANWNSVYSSVAPTSANWNSVYSSVSNVSANWNSVYSNVQGASADWDSVYSSVANTSANWDSVYSSVSNVSANWQNTYTNYSTNSASYATNTTVNNVSSQLVLNTEFNSYKTNVASATATLLPTTVYQSASGAWQSVYNTVQSNSASNWDNASVTEYVNINFIPLSGGTITGNLSVLGDIAYIDTTVAVTSAIIIDTSSTETALRITQRGTGDVIRVEDIANVDSTPFVVNSNGFVGIGTSYPNEVLTVVGNISASGSIYIENGMEISSGVSPTTLYVEGGKVGVNTETPNEDLTVVGNISANGSYYGDGSNLTGLVLATDFSNYQTNVASATATLLPTTVYQSASGSWQSVYSNVQSNSATYATVSFATATFLPLSGGAIINGLSASQLQVGTGGGSVLYVGANKVGINTETPNYGLTVVGSVSATDTIYSSNGSSDNWNSVYSSVTSASGAWQDTYTNFSTNSASYVKTDVTNVTPGLSAITKLVAVSAIPLVQEVGTMYVLI